MSQKIKIALIQSKSESNPAHNLLKTVHSVERASRQGAQIICLQELFKSDYFPQTKNRKHFALAEKIPGASTQLFSNLARELKAVLIVPLFEEAGKLFYNSLAVIDADGRIAGKYRKMHLPNDPCFYEKYYFQKGNLGFPVVQTAYGKIGALICWDQWFPEAARTLALAGAQIIFYPTAIASRERQPHRERLKEKTAWEMIQRSHAAANGVFVASVNRVGREGKLNFWGSSFIVGPFGELIKQAGERKEEILIGTCDLAEISRVRKVWPFLKQRRSDAYQK